MRVPDPIFGLVAIPDHPWLQDPRLRRQLNRLQKLRQLGLASVVFPGAEHTRWQHHIGVHHLACMLPAGTLDREDYEALRVLAILGGIGHLPGGYATERAVLRAARLSSQVGKQLQAILDPAQERVARYAQAKGVAVPQWRDMLRDDDYRSLHAWLTASKLAGLPIEGLGYRDRLLYHRVCRDSPVNRWYRFLCRVDYVQRDAYYVGVGRIHLHPDNIVRDEAGVPAELSEQLTRQLADYLRQYLYWDERLFVLEEFIAGMLCDRLVGGRPRLKTLLDWTDSDLAQYLGLEALEQDLCLVSRLEAESTAALVEPVPSECVALANRLCVRGSVVVVYDHVERLRGPRHVFTVLAHRQRDARDLLRCASKLGRWAEGRVPSGAVGTFLRGTVGNALGCRIDVKNDRMEACERYVSSAGWPLGLHSLPDGVANPLILLTFADWTLRRWKSLESRPPELWEVLAVVYCFLLKMGRAQRIVLPWALVTLNDRQNEVDAVLIEPGDDAQASITLVEATSSDSLEKAAEDEEKCKQLVAFFEQSIPGLHGQILLVNARTVDDLVIRPMEETLPPMLEKLPFAKEVVESGAYVQMWKDLLKRLGRFRRRWS